MFKVATWNVNSLKVRLEHVLAWIAEHQPDVLALQETKTIDENFPEDAIKEAGYHVSYSGQKTYNGVAVLSRHSIEDVITDIPKLDDPQRRILGATIQGIRFLNLYVPNGQSVDSEKYYYKLNWLAKVKAYTQEQLAQHEQVVLLGDFNIAPEDRDVHDPIAWEGHVLVSPKEREALKELMQLGLHDSFRLFEQAEKSYSWWDYRRLGFRRNHGMRIDHILVNGPLSECCKRCWIDKAPRKLERPSDHTPVVAEFEL